MLTFDEWYDKNEENLSIECAESGADREMDFDFGRFCEDRYDQYKNTIKHDESVEYVPNGDQQLFG